MDASACRHCHSPGELCEETATGVPSYSQVYLTGDRTHETLKKLVESAEVAGFVPGIMHR
jgi:hypothetical protein